MVKSKKIKFPKLSSLQLKEIEIIDAKIALGRAMMRLVPPPLEYKKFISKSKHPETTDSMVAFGVATLFIQSVSKKRKKLIKKRRKLKPKP